MGNQHKQCAVKLYGYPGGGGGTAIYGLYRYVPLHACEGYVFQAGYSKIGYINQSAWV